MASYLFHSFTVILRLWERNAGQSVGQPAVLNGKPHSGFVQMKFKSLSPWYALFRSPHTLLVTFLHLSITFHTLGQYLPDPRGICISHSVLHPMLQFCHSGVPGLPGITGGRICGYDSISLPSSCTGASCRNNWNGVCFQEGLFQKKSYPSTQNSRVFLSTWQNFFPHSHLGR